jgi:hypothetical protein
MMDDLDSTEHGSSTSSSGGHVMGSGKHTNMVVATSVRPLYNRERSTSDNHGDGEGPVQSGHLLRSMLDKVSRKEKGMKDTKYISLTTSEDNDDDDDDIDKKQNVISANYNNEV